MPEFGRPVLLVPAYRPPPSLAEMVRALAESREFASVIIVDDGSGAQSAGVFDELGAIEGVRLLRHAVNLGKGAALKSGLNCAAVEFPHSVGVVTADADGQHRVEDIRAVARGLIDSPKHLVLGVRAFRGRIPLRSRLGNAITRQVIRFFIGRPLLDTQTGLRGIPMELVPELLRLKPTGFDFELDMLLTCGHVRREIAEIPIETVYIDDNRSSHFNPLLDSMRIYFVFLRFSSVSLITSVIDNLVFVGLVPFGGSLLACQLTARATACLFNYTANKSGVFHSQARNRVALPKYAAAAFLAGLLSYFIFSNLSRRFGINVVAAKILTETGLFIVSFIVQRDVVFKRDETEG